ncbi:retrovirus-related pol polyprotein from transposon TNT 1-94 [Tanacetum coccineum]
MDLETAQTNTTTKLPILKQENGNSFKLAAQTTTNAKGTSTTLILGPVTADEKVQKKNDVKARSMLLIALPNEHLLTFNQYKDAKTFALRIESLDSIFNRLQKIVIQRNKLDLDTMSFDDLYNNFKIVEQEVKGTANSSSSSSTQNIDFVSSPSCTNKVNTAYEVSTANTQVSPTSTQVSTASTQVSTANLNDLEEIDLKWQLALLSMRTRRTINVEETSSKAMLAIDGAGFDWSYMADDEVPTNMALMAFLDSKFNKSEFNLATYKRGLASVEEQLIFYKKNEVIFCEKLVVLKRDISYKDSEISMLKRSQITDNSRNGVGFVSYNVVLPPYTGLFSPPKINLSTSGLEEFQQFEFEGYRLKTSKSVSEDICNEVREFPDAPLVEELVSNDKSQGPRGNQRNWYNQKSQQLGSDFVMYNKTCFVCKSFDHVQANCNYHQRERVVSGNNYTRVNYNYYAKKAHPSAYKNMAPRAVLIKTGLRSLNTARPVNTAHHKTTVYSARPMSCNPQKEDQRYVDSRCSRHMTRNMSYLSDFKEFDGGYVTFGGRAKKGKITGKGSLKLAEAVNTTCYVQNMVLVVKPHNKTPYELFRGKFDGKSDKGFFVGYSLNSKAFRVYNIRTRKVEENLHIRFLEDKLIIAGDGPKWLFDIDVLTKSMNYMPVVAGINSNDFIGGIDDQERPKNSAQDVNTAGPSINTASINFNTGSLNINIVSLTVTTVPLEATHANFFSDETELDMSNITTTYPVPSTPNTRIHKDHSLDHVIGDVQSGVYINKKDERGIVNRNKARLVAHGYTQEEGINYDEVFPSVARIEAIRLFLAYASFKDFFVYQMDMKSAFLYGKIEEEVYVCQPLGFEDPEFPNRVYKAEKALYGLHQVPKAWVKGLQVTQKDDGIFICQDKYVEEILKKFSFSTMKTASTPMETSKPLLKDAEAEDVDVYLYRSMIGSLMYLTASRPDIMFTDSPFNLEAYTNSDYAGASLDRKSTIGGCQFLRSGLISWQCKKQTIVATYTTEAYTIYIVKNLVFHLKTKHAEIRHHFIRDSNEKKLTQFWQTATASTLDNGEMEITATIDGKVKIVIEASIRRHLNNMRRASKGYIEVDIPLFPTMLVQGLIFQGEGSTVPVESHHTPTGAPSTLQPQLSPTLKSSIRQETKVPQPSSLPHTKVADEAASTYVDVKHEGAATTVTSLDAG